MTVPYFRLFPSYHDEEWLPKVIAPNLGAFFKLLAAWLDVFIGEYSSLILDSDCVVRPEFLDSLKGKLRHIVDGECIENLTPFIG